MLPAEIFPKAPIRAADLAALIERLQRRQHCAILGASNMGKSALLGSLLTGVARRACRARGDDASADPIFVFIDFLEATHSEHAFYELLLRRIIDAFEHSISDDSVDAAVNVSVQLIESLRDIHENLVHESSDVAIRSAFASGIRKLMRATSHRIVLILDEFDDGFRSLPPWPFRHLRAVANAQDDLQYIVATTHRLIDLRDDDETYEFRELFHMNMLELQPLDAADSARFVAYLDQRRGESLEPWLSNMIQTAAGGYPGILERLYEVCYSGALSALQETNTLTIDEACLAFCAEPSIEKECKRLWNELEEAERAALLTLVDPNASTAFEELPLVQQQTLRRKGIVFNEPATISSPLFACFIRSLIEPPTTTTTSTPSSVSSSENLPSDSLPSGIYCDLDNGRIWVDAQEITWELGSEHQRQLILLLFSRAGVVCSYDEIAEEVWGVGEGVTPAAIRELVNRIRRKLPDRDMIVNIPGKGYRLVLPE